MGILERGSGGGCTTVFVYLVRLNCTHKMVTVVHFFVYFAIRKLEEKRNLDIMEEKVLMAASGCSLSS